MVPFTPELLTDLSLRMALDGGGYAWENLPVELPGVAACWWRDADPDYLGLQDVPEARGRWYEGLAVLFAPNTGHFPMTKWPAGWCDPDGRRWRLLATGDFFVGASRECDCWGRIVADHVADADPDACVMLLSDEAMALTRKDPRIVVVGISTQYAWEYLEASNRSRPRPDCRRCDGDGYVEWPTGEWAIYEEVS